MLGRVTAVLEDKLREEKLLHVQLGASTILNAMVTQNWIKDAEDYPIVEDLDTVYAIHAAMVTDPLAKQVGGVVGYKQGGIGAVEGANCVYGVLFGCGIVNEPKGLSYSKFNLFGAEAEICFFMGKDLPPKQGEYTEAEVWDAVCEFCPCIELVGKRHCIAGASNLMNLADASCAAGVVCGKRFAASSINPDTLRSLSTHIEVDGEAKTTGAGAKCPLGSPLAALTFVVNHLNQRGMMLRASELVISGAFCKSRDYGPESTLVVDFGEFGKVKAVIDP